MSNEKAALTGIAVLFLATGTAHAERYTPTPEMHLPPAEYDKPFVGKLEEFIAKDQEELESFCSGLGDSVVGCARHWPASESGPPLCDIYLAPDELIRSRGSTTEIVRRHEIGHCNGWRHAPNIDPWSLKVNPSMGVMAPDWPGYPAGTDPFATAPNPFVMSPQPQTTKAETGTAHAEEKLDDHWWTDCRHGWIHKQFKAEDMEGDFGPVHIMGTSARITYDELRKLLKDLPRITRALKACDAYEKCLADRDAGKVKHCYENDRRWREFFTGAW